MGADQLLQYLLSGVTTGSIYAIVGIGFNIVYSSTGISPMRPRSWCSCDRPKRSACSTTITVALATSTPTSITVVAYRQTVRGADFTYPTRWV